jgi:hypothetical protein
MRFGGCAFVGLEDALFVWRMRFLLGWRMRFFVGLEDALFPNSLNQFTFRLKRHRLLLT